MRRLQYLLPVSSCQLRTTPHPTLCAAFAHFCRITGNPEATVVIRRLHSEPDCECNSDFSTAKSCLFGTAPTQAPCDLLHGFWHPLHTSPIYQTTRMCPPHSQTP